MSMMILIPILVLALAFILRVQIAFGMLAASVFYFLAKGLDMGLLADNVLVKIHDNYIIMAAPLFVFTANVMNSGEITDLVFKFSNGLVGRWKGGTGHVNVLASLIFSGMTGSAVADASGLGLMEIAAMRKEGYDDGFSCAITAASATIGPIFPPSIPFIVYSMLSGASVGNLFLAGMVPGILLAIALMMYVAYIANKRNYPSGVKYTFREFMAFTVKAFPALLTPVILLAGIYTGVMTPTEAGAVAAFYALMISIFVYRTLGVERLLQILVDTAKTTGVLGLIVGGAFSFSYIVAIEKVPFFVSNAMLSLTDNKYVFLLLVNILFLLLGMVIDTAVLQLVFIPIVLPLVKAMGIDLVHFGVLLSLNMMIGLSTPPFGMLLFIVSGVSKTPLQKVIKEMLPMIAVMLLVLLLVTYVPDIVLFVPRTFGR